MGNVKNTSKVLLAGSSRLTLASIGKLKAMDNVTSHKLPIRLQSIFTGCPVLRNAEDKLSLSTTEPGWLRRQLLEGKPGDLD